MPCDDAAAQKRCWAQNMAWNKQKQPLQCHPPLYLYGEWDSQGSLRVSDSLPTFGTSI